MGMEVERVSVGLDGDDRSRDRFAADLRLGLLPRKRGLTDEILQEAAHDPSLTRVELRTVRRQREKERRESKRDRSPSPSRRPSYNCAFCHHRQAAVLVCP